MRPWLLAFVAAVLTAITEAWAMVLTSIPLEPWQLVLALLAGPCIVGVLTYSLEQWEARRSEREDKRLRWYIGQSYTMGGPSPYPGDDPPQSRWWHRLFRRDASE